jgi:hypothetical protein
VERTSSRAGVSPAEVQRLSRCTFSPPILTAFYLADLEFAVRISLAHCSVVFSIHFRDFSSSLLPYM